MGRTWKRFFHKTDDVVDVEVSIGYGVGAEFSGNINGVAVSGTAKWTHEYKANEHFETSEGETAELSLNISEVINGSIKAEASQQTHWNYDDVTLTISTLGKDIVNVSTNNDKITAEIVDQKIVLKAGGYLGLGASGAITINLSEIGRILNLLPEKEKVEYCH